MNNRWLRAFIILLLVILSTQNVRAQDKKVVEIGIVHDGFENVIDRLLDGLKDELTSLLGSKYDIQIPPDKILGANWSTADAEADYYKLANDQQVDIILSFGILSGAAIAGQDYFPKSVIVTGILDPELYGVQPTAQNTSGIHNFTYLLSNRSLPRDLDVFYQVIPYKNVGVVFNGELQGLIRLPTDFLSNTMKKNHTKFATIPFTGNINEVLHSLNGIDAVYLSYLGKFEGSVKSQLISELSAKGIPTFSWSVADLKIGALGAVSPEENFSKIFRRISLNIEAILGGEDPANFPVHVSFEEKLTLNMAAAKKIGFSPKFTTLSEADLINDYGEETTRILYLNDVIQEALDANLELKIEQLAVQMDEKEVRLAKSKLLPSLDVSASGVKIDKKSAEKSFGLQAEHTLSGKASFQQLIFSEQALGNISIQKHLLKASEFSRDQIMLDIILEAGQAYFNVLRAKTFLKIRKDNITLIKNNLKIAKQRVAIGYSGPSEVYRWESQLATEMRNLVEAQNGLRLAKILLNQILCRPLDEEFSVRDVTLPDSLSRGHVDEEMFKNLDNPRSAQILTNFLVEKAKLISPEIKQINATAAALERSLASIKRQRFIPTIGLGAETSYIFSRTGAGTDGISFNGQPLDPADFQWNVGLNVSLPLFKGGEISLQAQQTEIEVLKIESQKRHLLQNVETNLRAKILDLALSAANLNFSKRAADFAAQSLELAQDSYSKGAVSIVELMDAQNAALNADLSSSNSTYEFYINLLNTERAMGVFLFMKSRAERMEFFAPLKGYFTEVEQ